MPFTSISARQINNTNKNSMQIIIIDMLFFCIHCQRGGDFVPPSFKTGGLYTRPPDAISYIRGEDIRGTVAFYQRWQGMDIVCRITGLKEGVFFMDIDKNGFLPLTADKSGVLKAVLFRPSLCLGKIKGIDLSLTDSKLKLAVGKIK